MNRSGLQPPLVIADDYNPSWRRPRAGAAARTVRALSRIVARCLQIIADGLVHHPRRTWALPLILGTAAFALLWRWDGALSESAARVSASIGGDLRRELHAWQQFGAAGSIVFTSIVVLALDRTRARRLLDLYLSVAIAGVICTTMKMGLGRPRPRPEFEDPFTFLGPIGVYPVRQADGSMRLVHAWEGVLGLGQRGLRAGNELWSMPSSHTLYAAVLAVFLGVMYPRLRWLWIALALLVGLCRLIFDAHWPTDVIAGACVGLGVAWTVHARWAGVRLLDWLWRKIVNPAATPALPAQQEAFRRKRIG